MQFHYVSLFFRFFGMMLPLILIFFLDNTGQRLVWVCSLMELLIKADMLDFLCENWTYTLEKQG